MLNNNRIYCIEGYASVFNVVDRSNEIIRKGAFLSQNYIPGDIKLLWQHDITSPVGLVSSIIEDNFGLFISAEIIFNTNLALEAKSLVETSVIDSLSIGFVSEEEKCNSMGQNEILKAKLYEISLVTFGSNPMAKITYSYPIKKQR